jgi:hypothetical protein
LATLLRICAHHESRFSPLMIGQRLMNSLVTGRSCATIASKRVSITSARKSLFIKSAYVLMNRARNSGLSFRRTYTLWGKTLPLSMSVV